MEPSGVDDRARILKTRTADLVACLTLYAPAQGGYTRDIHLGWGCPCFPDRSLSAGWDAWPLVGEEPLRPGETRTVGFVFLSSDEAAQRMRQAGTFYLWDGRIIGEAHVLPEG